jgi:nucleoside-diphosphate-sugar epimerase
LKILVTGAAGFIGSHLTEALLKQGHAVLAIDALLPNLYPEKQKRKNWELLGELENSPERLILDLREPIQTSVIEDCDYIFHLAAMPGLSLSWEQTKLYIDCNLLATANLLKACNLDHLKKFFYISTSSVYGRSITGDESSALSPISPYGVTKLAAEAMVTAYSDATGMPFSIFRPFSVYGPRQRSDMGFNIFIKKLMNKEEIAIFGDGSQSRTNTYVSDLVEGLISGIDNAKAREVYNLSGREQYSVLDVIKLLSQILDIQPKLLFQNERLGDQKETKTSLSKAENELGYFPSTTLKEGLERQIEWQIANS